MADISEEHEMAISIIDDMENAQSDREALVSFFKGSANLQLAVISELRDIKLALQDRDGGTF